jgi:hypothetical protein
MADDFTPPGEGWLEVASIEGAPEYVVHVRPDGTTQRWVLKDPVPPLPTELFTVIEARVARINDSVRQTLILTGIGWVSVDGGARLGATPKEKIISWKPLAEPCTVTPHAGRDIARETAKDIIDRVKKTSLMQLCLMVNPRNADELDAIAKDYGVEP